MDFSYSDDQKLLREQIVRFAKNELSPGALERDEKHAFPHELWLKCGEMGLQGMPVPEAYGGSNLDALSTAIGLEALGHGCEDGGLVFSVCAHLLACVVPIWKHGSEEQKQRYLPKLCKGRVDRGQRHDRTRKRVRRLHNEDARACRWRRLHHRRC